MPITQELLAKRLKEVRTDLELTQEEVADRLGVKRPTIAQIEGGNRAVTGIELAQFASIYKRSLEFFLAEPEEVADSGVVLLRSNTELSEPDLEYLEVCVETCKAATALEGVLGKKPSGVSFSYSIERPQSRWEAVEQGMKLAAMERKRLNLGNLPVRNIVEIISQHGVRVASYTLTDDVSGMFFVGSDTGKVILVNGGHSSTRRLFSYAHEYAHLLVDSAQTPGGISRFGTRDDLLEVRANTFAAHFLMPDEGVREFLDGLGGPSRQVMEIFDLHNIGRNEGREEDDEREETSADEALLTVQRRAAPGSQDVKMLDALRLARHFGTSYTATVYHLLNLKVITKEASEKLLGEKRQAEKVNRVLGVQNALQQENVAELKKMTANLIVEAILLEEITLQKAYEYAKLVRFPREDIDSLLTH